MVNNQAQTQTGSEVHAKDTMNTSSKPVRGPVAARRPLVVSTANPRYFTFASYGETAVYLTGSHIWNNLHDGPPTDPDGLWANRRRQPSRPVRGRAHVLRRLRARSLGDGRHAALPERMNLIEMKPRDDLSSTGYALANPGKEYLVLEPSGTADPFTVTLDAGAYTIEWFSVDGREAVGAGEVTVEKSTTSTSAPRLKRPALSCCI